MRYLIFGLFLFLTGSHMDPIFFQSESIRELEMQPYGEPVTIIDDESEPIEVQALVDQNGMLYWHRKLHTPVCQTGECKEIDVGLYWKCTGEFMGLEVYREHLTRTDHSIFSPEDYALLLKTLGNDWSILREYAYDDLLSEPMEEPAVVNGTEAVTGATRKEISEETVADAVYTTYTLWHLIHAGEKEQLRSHSAVFFNQDSPLLEALIGSSDPHYGHFVLELFAEGKLDQSPQVLAHIQSSLQTDQSNIQRELALKSLASLALEEASAQKMIASIYPMARPNERPRILNYMKTPQNLSPELYHALIKNLGEADEWLIGRTLEVIKIFPAQDPEVVKLAEALTKSNNGFSRQSATGYLDFIRKKGNF